MTTRAKKRPSRCHRASGRSTGRWWGGWTTSTAIATSCARACRWRLTRKRRARPERALACTTNGRFGAHFRWGPARSPVNSGRVREHFLGPPLSETTETAGLEKRTSPRRPFHAHRSGCSFRASLVDPFILCVWRGWSAVLPLPRHLGAGRAPVPHDRLSRQGADHLGHLRPAAGVGDLQLLV